MVQEKAAPLIVIVGETASGKSALAMEVAAKFNGEIICADSRTVYKGMDIGTAKPSGVDREKIRHHILDVVQPDESFSAAAFKKMACTAIDDITRRGKLPVLVGGTGLYIDAVLYNFQFRPAAKAYDRAKFAKLSVEELQQKLKDRKIPLPENFRNPRHLMRALETGGVPPKRGKLRPSTLLLGLRVDREKLRTRVRQRVEAMVKQGLIEEVKQLGERYGWEVEALQAPGYKVFRKYLHGELTLTEAKAEFVRSDLALAKRQRTWFKRNESIHWVDDQSKAVDFITTYLNK